MGKDRKLLIYRVGANGNVMLNGNSLSKYSKKDLLGMSKFLEEVLKTINKKNGGLIMDEKKIEKAYSLLADAKSRIKDIDTTNLSGIDVTRLYYSIEFIKDAMKFLEM